MPTHKGIQISVISQVELQAHPEFPHPESSQFTYRSPGAYSSGGYRSPGVRQGSRANEWTPPSASSDSKADRLLGRQTVVSVYIPSAIGARFWLHYNVLEPEALQAQWFYFKLFMNGRLITSWGVNAITNPEGQVMRGLFEPSAEFNYKKEDGTIMEKGGAESRPFFFGPGPEPGDETTAATDGGLIEVLAYRARGRRRRVQEPSIFKAQEGYGIVMPSEGLVPKPEEAKYYDWHLKDAKDSPFAIFKFHYRSWDTLKSLQLIPESHPMDSYKPTDGFFADWVKQVEESRDDDDSIVYDSSPIAIGALEKKTPFDESPNSIAKGKGKQRTYLLPPQPKNNPFSGKFSDDSLNSFSSISIPTSRISAAQVEKPVESPWKNYLRRPLPEVPTRQSSLKKPKGHSRQSSNVSSVPSVTPSLQSYVDRNETLSPAPEVGVASVLQVVASTPPKDIEDGTDESEEEEVSSKEFYQLKINPNLDYSDSPNEESPCATSTSATKRRGMSSPPPALLNYLEYPILRSNITLRKTRRSPKMTSLNIKTTSLSDTTPTIMEREGKVTVSEGEWMAKTPSPVMENTNMNSWSPVPGRRKGNGKERDIIGADEIDELDKEKGVDEEGLAGKVLRKKAMAWFDKIRASDDVNTAGRSRTRREEEETLLEVPNALMPMPGNWI